jgi:hypothetical protein
MGREENRKAYSCRMFVAGEAPVARRRVSKATPRLPGAPTILRVLVASS